MAVSLFEALQREQVCKAGLLNLMGFALRST
jgi:hypothetical protein